MRHVAKKFGPVRPLVWGAGLGLFLGLCRASGLAAAEASAWATSPHSAARLVDAGPTLAGEPRPGQARLVGVAIRLDPPFITYWRSPGEAGVPPRFDFAGSDNLSRAAILYPAPRLLDEDGSAAFGYTEDVTFPVLVEAADPGRPVTLALALDYAVCARICLPATARLQLRLEGGAGTGADAVRAALLDVPQPRAIGAAGAVRIDGLDVKPGETVLHATTPDGTGVLFAEAPEPWYVQASAGRPSGEGGRVSFILTAPPPVPSGPVPTAPLRLTLVSPAGAIETTVPLDEALSRP